MWLVWSVVAFSVAVAGMCVVLFREDWRRVARGWQCLAGSGVALSVGGLAFIIRFWEPLAGPYMADARYPLGPYLNTWVVSFGFMWLAFGVVFLVLALRGGQNIKVWWAMLATWALAWLPHAVIAVGFLVAGRNEPSIAAYRDWAWQWPGALSLWVSGLVVAAHLGLSTVGFALTGRVFLRDRRARHTS